MSIIQHHIVRLGKVLLMLLTAGASVGYAAECNTSSGSTCKVSCSTGTATATCNSNSKTCSTSCSDSSGNMEDTLVRSLQIVTEGGLDSYDARDLVQYNIDIDHLFNYGGGTRQVDTYYGVITIDVD